MKKLLRKDTKILVLLGGLSDEREVSLETGHLVMSSLKENGYANVSALDMTRSVDVDIRKAAPDVVFNALHGTWGEDGRIQGLLDILDVPHTGSGVTASALAMDKILSRTCMEQLDIPCAEGTVMTVTDSSAAPFELPVVMKDPRNGSSRGVFIVHTPEAWKTACRSFTDGSTVLVERFYAGREINVAVMNDRVLGDVEIIPANDFYDYESKYLSDETRYEVSPECDDTVREIMHDAALRFHCYIGCRGVTRSDFIVSDDSCVMLELNTLPGMTEHSLVPMIGRATGYSYIAVVEALLEDALRS